MTHETVRLVAHAVELWKRTGGLFDPTVLAALMAIGYDRSFNRIPIYSGNVALLAPRPAPGCKGIAIDHDALTVALPTGVALDLGGVGKGFAADLVVAGLVERGAAGACVGIGGDVSTAGVGPHAGRWTIPVEDPRDEYGYPLFDASLSESAVVTSTTKYRRWYTNGRLQHHLIDPREGVSASSGIEAVVAVASKAWWAEGVAKAVLIAGAERGRSLAEALDVHCWMVTSGGDVIEPSCHERVTA